MPYKDRQKQLQFVREHQKQRYRRKRAELIAKLGGKCVVCGTTENLQIHHIEPIDSRSRTNANSYFNPEGKELRYTVHHSHTESWRGKRNRKKVN
jgi:5-methylcytosine-specific restriction endonuclease McrA